MTRLLIVDDEDSIRRSLAGLLSDEGYEIVTASDGNAALALLREEAADFDLPSRRRRTNRVYRPSRYRRR